MKPYFDTFKTIFLVSFLGSFTPGMITMGVLQAVVSGGMTAAFAFSLGAVSVEIIFIWLVLFATGWFYTRQYIFRYLEWISIGMMAIFTVLCLVKLISASDATQAMIPVQAPWFLSGALLRLVTPTFVAFWLGWHLTMLSTEIAKPTPTARNVSAIAAGVGTFSAHGLFILLYLQASEYLAFLQTASRWIIFVVLLSSTLWMGIRILRRNRAQGVSTNTKLITKPD